MKRFYIGRRGVSLNEGGHIFTFDWSLRGHFVRVWFKPNFWKAGPALFERCWRWY